MIQLTLTIDGDAEEVRRLLADIDTRPDDCRMRLSIGNAEGLIARLDPCRNESLTFGEIGVPEKGAMRVELSARKFYE